MAKLDLCIPAAGDPMDPSPSLEETTNKCSLSGFVIRLRSGSDVMWEHDKDVVMRGIGNTRHLPAEHNRNATLDYRFPAGFGANASGLSDRDPELTTMRCYLRILLLLGVSAFVCLFATAQSSQQQLCTVTHKSSLYCLIPNQLGSTSGEFSALNEAVGTVVSDLPLASPAAGIVYTLDPQLKLEIPSDRSLGPILTQRPETVGRHRLYFAVMYQYFRFQDIDGQSLKILPSVTKTSDLAFVTINNLNLSVHQAVGYFTFGLTTRIDLSVALPILSVQERFSSAGSKIILSGHSTQPTPVNITNKGNASGFGDIVFTAKDTIWKTTSGGLAAGLELRLPSGNELNFSGSGAIGIKPYISVAYGKRVSVHGNMGYQVNGYTSLVTSSSGGKGQLPNRLFYSGGGDCGIGKWMTMAVDILAERVFDAHRIVIGTSAVNADNFQTITAPSPVDSYNRTDGSIGIKLKPYRNLILTGNVLLKLNQGGLRCRFVPLGGVSYTF